MTGPEFYKVAAATLDDAEGRIGDCTPGESAIALAMIGAGRATLALAAATALGNWTPDGTLPQPDRMDWWRAASGEPAERQRVKEARAAEAAEMADLAEPGYGKHKPGHNCGYCPDEAEWERRADEVTS